MLSRSPNEPCGRHEPTIACEADRALFDGDVPGELILEARRDDGRLVGNVEIALGPRSR